MALLEPQRIDIAHIEDERDRTGILHARFRGTPVDAGELDRLEDEATRNPRVDVAFVCAVGAEHRVQARVHRERLWLVRGPFRHLQSEQCVERKRLLQACHDGTERPGADDGGSR